MIESLSIPGIKVITPPKFEDERGFFAETHSDRRMQDLGVSIQFVQENHSLSRQKGVLRGLHFQAPPHAQDKLVRCTRGRVLDVAVDIRTGSPTYGQHVSVELSADNFRQLLVPIGFAHGFLTLEPDCEIQYKVSSYYAPESDRVIRWDDPDLAIDWPIDRADIILSDKDRAAGPLTEVGSPFVYEENLLQVGGR